MVYDWQPHKDECYRLYISERKPMEEIMRFMRDTHKFNPSKRAFQTQFRRWGFPSKQKPAYKDKTLVERVKELFDQNYKQADMLQVLIKEGFEIKSRDLLRLRTQNRWLLRAPNGFKGAHEDETATIDSIIPADVMADLAVQSQERLEKTQTDIDERWNAKKRRRRTKGYAGFPADPPGPPRYPSETTLEESKAILSLDAEQYRIIREKFQQISEEEQVSKKTTAGGDKWQHSKDRLVQDMPHLLEALRTDEVTKRKKELAIDIICSDVTKRMRLSGSRMKLADAKNTLRLNPEESRQVRSSFYNLLQQCNFTRKIEMGEDIWEQLKERWIASEPVMQTALNVGETEDRATKDRAAEILCRDVLKRLRGDFNRQKTAKRKIRQVPSTTNAMEDAEDTTIPVLPGIEESQLDSQLDPGLFDPIFETRVSRPVAVYIRSNPASEVHGSDKVWLATLTTRKVSEVQQIVNSKWPEVIVSQIDGISKDPAGREISFLIDEDDELDAYLDHVSGRKATFMVTMNLR